MRKRIRDLDLISMLREFVTPVRYLEILRSEGDSIKSVKIIPARLGGNDFGKLLVEFKTPKYVRKPARPR